MTTSLLRKAAIFYRRHRLHARFVTDKGQLPAASSCIPIMRTFDTLAKCELCGRRRSTRKMVSGPDDVLDYHICSRPKCESAKIVFRSLGRVYDGGSKFELQAIRATYELHSDSIRPPWPSKASGQHTAELPGYPTVHELPDTCIDLRTFATSPRPPSVNILAKPRFQKRQPWFD
jgi:hypothetical protein